MKKSAFSFLVFSFLLLSLPGGAFAQAAVLSLDPATGTFNKGCVFSLKINLDTGGAQTDGTDAVLIYDASRLNATSITNGTVYPDFPGNNIDAQSGKITISGLASVNASFSGRGTLATINFTVQSNAPTGVTEVKFEFNPQDKANTRDSNVVERGTIVDVLNSVVNGNYTIGTGSCLATPAPTSAPVVPGSTVAPMPRGAPGSQVPGISTPSAVYVPVQVPIKTLPEGGTPQLTSILAIVGLSLTVLGILGVALL